MKFYPEDYSVEVVAGFTDLNGQAVVPTDVSAVLYDGEDEVMVDFGSLPFDPAAGSKAIVIPSAFNRLEDGELRAARILRVTLTTAAGDIRRSLSYVVESEQRLVMMTNTFQSYEAAEILAMDYPASTGWSTASEDQRKAALVEAYRRLTNIPMKYQLLSTTERSGVNYDRLGANDYASERRIARDQWAEITAELFADLPRHFRKALRAAQFAEADELLTGDNVGKKHRAGIVSETIGESSVTLRPGRVDYGISSRSLAALTGYIDFNMRITRA